LLSIGVGEQNIIQESFCGKSVSAQTDAKAESAGGFIEFTRSNRTCTYPVGGTVLETAEMNGIQIPYGCRQGQCGTCATRLLDGDIRMDREDGLDPALKAQGYVLTCVGRPQGNIRLDV